MHQILRKSDFAVSLQQPVPIAESMRNKKREMWRNLETYTEGTYDDFLREIYKSYPELKSEVEGTLRDLERLCARNRGIQLHEEGNASAWSLNP